MTSKNLISPAIHLSLVACLGAATSPAFAAASQAAKGKATAATSPAAAPAASVSELPKSGFEKATETISKYVGLTYFTFFDGPGVGEPLGNPPGVLGRPSDSGLNFWTNLSLRGKISDRFAVDYQFRLQQVVTNELEFRDQGGRLGISGTLLKGADWSLTGALNSDIPGVGQIPSQRTLIVNPGLFASFNYRPQGSRWSVFSLVAPRFFFYRDADAMAQQDTAQGLLPGMKPQVALQFQPSINYAFNERHGARLGVMLDVRKQVAWDSFRRWFWPVDVGYTYSFSKRFNLYPHFRFSGPWDNSLRSSLGVNVPWTHTASVGLWINGVIL
jgi:hypothetical protein